MGGAARPLPAELLCQGSGQPHRRSQCGMERARGVDDERRPGAVAQGGRQGHCADRLSLPVPPQPARRLMARAAGPTSNNRKRHKKWSLVRHRRTDPRPRSHRRVMHGGARPPRRHYTATGVSAGSLYNCRTFSRSSRDRVSSDRCPRSRAMTSHDLGHVEFGWG